MCDIYTENLSTAESESYYSYIYVKADCISNQVLEITHNELSRCVQFNKMLFLRYLVLEIDRFGLQSKLVFDF